MKNVEGKVVVITGGSSGLGETTAISIAKAVAYAIEQPDDVDINELVIRPTVQDF
ncbi:hypothetical protein [Poseidonibacter antarcticus]|uniref:hypothetical protein n=1 Tax=Poseidonibacter antarcticus TaxID=2478538 RepID=UPI001D182242